MHKRIVWKEPSSDDWELELAIRTEELIHKIKHSDLIKEVKDWPKHYEQLLRESHKNHSERFRLWNFFYVNGIPPSMATDWVLANGRYAPSSVTELRDHEKRSLTQEGKHYLAKYKSWNLSLNKNT